MVSVLKESNMIVEYAQSLLTIITDTAYCTKENIETCEMDLVMRMMVSFI